MLGATLVLSAAACGGGSTDKTNETNSGGDELLKIKIMGPDTTYGKFSMNDRAEMNVWKAMEEVFADYGLAPEFEVIANEQYETVLQTRTATATDLPDFLNVAALGDPSLLEMAADGQFKDIDSVLEKSDGTAKAFFETEVGKRSWNLNTTDDGKVYWISQVQMTTYEDKPASTNYNVLIRADWVEDLGLDMPTTADEFYDTIKAFQENDMNGSGTADEVLVANTADFSNGIAQWFGLYYSLSSFGITDGAPTDITSPWYQEGVEEYFTFLQKMITDGIMDPTAVGAAQGGNQIENNKAAAIVSYPMETWSMASVVGDDDALYVPLNLKGDPNIQNSLIIEPPMLSFGRYAFTSTSKSDEANARLLDVLCSDEYIELTAFGIEGETWEMKDGRKQLLPIAFHNAQEQAFTEGKVIGDFLWANGNMFPKRRIVPMENEMATVPEAQAQWQKDNITYEVGTPMGSGNYLSMATTEERDVQGKLITDLDSKSQELATALTLGTRSIDDLPAIIAELEALGLKDYLAVDQARLERSKDLGMFD